MVVEFNSQRGGAWLGTHRDEPGEPAGLGFLSLLYSMLSFPHAQLTDILAVSFSFSFGECFWNVNRMNRF